MQAPLKFVPINLGTSDSEKQEVAEDSSLEARQKQFYQVVGAALSDPVLGRDALAFKARLLGMEVKDEGMTPEDDKLNADRVAALKRVETLNEQLANLRGANAPANVVKLLEQEMAAIVIPAPKVAKDPPHPKAVVGKINNLLASIETR